VRARVVVSFEGAIVTEVELTQAVTVVGRHSACDICIDHPAVSGRHMLFRVVNQTVYAEDLASTNGTKVNGHQSEHQVVHHLDLIEVGRHKVHFFDDDMLAGRVGGLESTVQTDFERTMMSQNAQPAPDAPKPAPRRGDDELARTTLIPRLGPSQESVSTEQGEAGALALRVLAGGKRGDVVPLSRPNTMIGAAGADTALVIRRGRSFFIARLSGGAPRLNRKELAPGTHAIGPRDTIDVGGWSFEVIDTGS
jgi:pSer/pThr/pTyr-binding forkhead associated (FHA) protein